jgi:hypothetical protein
MITKQTNLEQTLQIWAMPQSKWHIEHHPDDDPFYFEVRTDKPWAKGAVMVCEQTVILTVPKGVDITRAAINTLEDAIKETRAEAEKQVMELKEQITTLLMLTHQPSHRDATDQEYFDQGVTTIQGDPHA